MNQKRPDRKLQLFRMAPPRAVVGAGDAGKPPVPHEMDELFDRPARTHILGSVDGEHGHRELAEATEQLRLLDVLAPRGVERSVRRGIGAGIGRWRIASLRSTGFVGRVPLPVVLHAGPDR